MLHHRRNAVLVMALAALAGACENPNTPPPPTTGSLTVTVQTTGNLPDPDGYQLTRTGTAPVMVAVNGSTRADSLAPGSYTLTLDKASLYCAPEGDTTQTATVVAGQTATVTFRMRCERNGVAWLTPFNGLTSLYVAFPGREPVTLASAVGGSRIRFSPDGRRIAYGAIPAGGGTAGILTIDLDSLRVALVTPTGSPARIHPAWSPDGTRLTYATSNPTQLRTIRVDGTAEETVWQAPAGQTGVPLMPVWSPDGTRIAFLRLAGSVTSIVIINADGTGERTLITLNTAPYLQIDWSPDGGSIVVPDQRDAGRGIYRVNVATGQATAVITSPTVAYRNPTYLRDGRIGFSGLNADNTLAGTWTINPDGSGLTQVTVPSFSGSASIVAWQ